MSDQGVDVTQWTIGQLLGKLKPGQLYSLIGVVITAISGIFAFGVYVGGKVDVAPAKADNLIIFEADSYGVNKVDRRFQAIMRWEPPSEQNYSFPSDITTTHAAWAFVRLRPISDGVREAKISAATGPFAIRNGSAVEIPLSDELFAAYESGSQWTQVIIFALPKGFKPEDGKQIKDYGSDAKVLVAASVRDRP